MMYRTNVLRRSVILMIVQTESSNVFRLFPRLYLTRNIREENHSDLFCSQLQKQLPLLLNIFDEICSFEVNCKKIEKFRF